MLKMLDDLEHRTEPHFVENKLQILRLESFDVGSTLKSFSSVLNDGFTNLIFFVKNLTVVDGNNKTAERIAGQISSMEKKLASMKFVSQANMLLPCPDGFKGDFQGYVASLEATRVSLVTTAFTSLEEFNTYLAAFLGDKNSKISLKDDGRKYKALKDQREAEKKLFESYFTSGVNQRQTMEKMFATKAEIIPTAKMSVTNWKALKQINLNDVKWRCDSISAKLQVVMDMASNKKDSDVSKQALLNLAEGSYEIARQVEHLALFMARCEIASVTTGNIFERLDKVLK